MRRSIPEILLIEAKRSASRPPMDATAYDLMLRAIPLIGRLEREAFMQAGEYLSRAIELEPDYAAAHAWYAYWQMFLVGQDWADDPAAAMEEAGQHAERAVVLDPYDARGLTIAGHVRAFLHRRLHEAIALHERALSLNPNLAMAWALSAIAYAYIGDPDRGGAAQQPLQEAVTARSARILLRRVLHPDPSAEARLRIGGCGGARGDGNEPVLFRDLQAVPCRAGPSRALAGGCGGASAAAWRSSRISPSQRFIATSPLERESDRDHYAEGLRLAGVPETVADAAEQLQDQVAH